MATFSFQAHRCGTSTSVLVLVLLVLALSACGGGKNGQDPDTAQLVAINVAPSVKKITQGKKQQFALMGQYRDAREQDVTAAATWSSEDESIVSIDEKGLATAVAEGETRIVVSYSGFETYAKVTVTPPPTALEIRQKEAVNDVLVFTVIENFALEEKKSKQLYASLAYGSDVTDDVTTVVQWSSADESIATVTKYGEVQAKAHGETKIIVTIEDITAEVSINVLPTISRLNILTSDNILEIGESIPLVAKVIYTNDGVADPDSSLKWSVSDSSIAEINAAKTHLIAKKTGVVILTAQYAGISSSLEFHVGRDFLISVQNDTGTSIALTWTDMGVEEYQLLWNNEGNVTKDSNAIIVQGDTQFEHTSLDIDKTYYYRVAHTVTTQSGEKTTETLVLSKELAVRPRVGEWENIVFRELRRKDFGVASAGNSVWFVGGATPSGVISLTVSDSVNVDLATGDSNTVDTFPGQEVLNPAVCGDGHFIYSLGGSEFTGPTAAGFVYDLEQDKRSAFYALPAPRTEHRCVIVNDHIYVVGGFDGIEVLNSIISNDRASKAWNVLSPMATPRRGAAITVAENRIIVSGGLDAANNYVASVEVFDTVEQTWSTLQDLQTPRARHEMVAFNGQLFVMGGETFNGITDSIENVVMNFDTPQSWQNSITMPGPRASFKTHIRGRELYVFGGYDVDGFVKDVAVLELLDQVWLPRRAPTEPRGEFATATDGMNIYAFGGRSPDGNATDTVMRYDVAANSWQTLASMTYTRIGASAVFFKDKFYVFGGELANGEKIPDVEMYDPATGEWTELKQDSESIIKPQARSFAVAEAVNNKIYVIGGSGAEKSLAVFDPSSATWAKEETIAFSSYGAASVVVGNNIFVLGGNDGTAMLANVSVYNPVTGLWYSLPAMPSRRMFFTAELINGRLYVAGGTGDSVFTAVDSFDFVSQTWRDEKPLSENSTVIRSELVDHKMFVLGAADIISQPYTKIAVLK